MRYFLGIDNGGTVTKAAIFDENGNEIAISSKNTPLITPKSGYNERDMLQMWDNTAECIHSVLKKANIIGSEICAIGCTGHGKGLYLWGKDNKPAYNAIASTDTRAKNIIGEWNENGVAARAQKKTLQPVIACQPVALLAWLKKEKPEIVSNIKWIFEAKDFIRFMFTDIPMAEVTDYSGTCLMNLTTKEFDRDLMCDFGIGDLYDCLPPLCLSYNICGTVSKKAAEKTGLAEGTPVCGGMFDIDACAVAMDVTTADKLCVITGTWSINEYPSDAYVRSDTTTHNSLFCIPNKYLIEESSPTSAGNLDWFLEHFMKFEKFKAESEGRPFYLDIDEIVEKLPSKDSDVLFLPFLYGTNSDKCDVAMFYGLTNSCKEEHMLRAIYEGVVFSHIYHIEKLFEFRKPPETVRLAGGAANSKIWVQIFADAIGIPVEVVPSKELGAHGCAMSAAVATGVYNSYEDAAKSMVKIADTVVPDMTDNKIYRKKYQRYKKLIEILGEM